MNCKQTQKTIQPYFDGELTQLERKSFEEHLRRCGVCRHEFEAYRGVFSLLGELDREPVPAGFEDAVISRVREGRRARVSRAGASNLWWVGVGCQPASRLIRYPLAAVVLLVAICFPFVMLRGGIREAASSFVVLAGDALVNINAAVQEFGVFYRLLEVLEKDLRFLNTLFNALTSLAWTTGETVMMPGLVLLAGVLVFALFYRSAFKRRPHNASYSI